MTRLRKIPSLRVALLCLCLLPGMLPAQDAQQRFDDAMTAIEQERLNTARRLLTSLVTDYPTLSRARLELARANYLARDFSGARAEAEKVLEVEDLPPQVRTTVLAFLAQIDADEARLAARHQWLPSLYAGGMYDSNVNFGVGRDIIQIGGTPFRVVDESRVREDFAAVIDAGLNHTFNPGSTFESGENTGFFLWQSQGNAYYRAYFDEQDFDLGVFTLRTGPAWVVPGRWRADVALQGDQLMLGGERLAFFTSLNPSLSWETRGGHQFTVEGIATYRDYTRDIDVGRDGWYGWGGLRWGRFFDGGRWGLQAGVAYFGFAADDDRFSFSGPGAFAGVVAETWRNGSVYARFSYRNYDFDGVEPGFDTSRDDDEYRVLAGFRHDFQSGWLDQWSLLGDFAWTDNRSPDVPIYEYDRYQLSLGLARSF